MRKISLIIITIITLSFLIILGIPLIFGFILEKEYPRLITQFNKNPNINIQLKDYQRGWFNSSANLQVVFSNQPLNMKNSLLATSPAMQFTVHQNMSHGPVIWFKDSKGNHQLFYGRAMIKNSIDQDHSDIQSTTFWTYDNHLNSSIASPKFQLEGPFQQLFLQGLAAEINYNMSNHQVHTHFILKNLQWLTKTIDKGHSSEFIKELELFNLDTTMDTSLHSNGLWYGVTNANINKIIFSPQSTNTASVISTHVVINQEPTGQDKTNVSVKADIKNLIDAKINLTDLKLDLNLNEFDNKALIQLNKVVQKNSLGYFDILNFITRGINIDLKQLKFSTPQGMVNLQTIFFFPPQVEKNIDPLYWLQIYKKIFLHVKLRLPESILNQWMMRYYQERDYAVPGLHLNPEFATKQQTLYWLENNIITKQNDHVFIAIDLKEGHLLLNGAKPKIDQYLLNLNELVAKQKLNNSVSSASAMKNSSQKTSIINSEKKLEQKSDSIKMLNNHQKSVSSTSIKVDEKSSNKIAS